VGTNLVTARAIMTGHDRLRAGSHTHESLLTPAEAAALVGVSRKTIYREVERGSLPALHAGRQLRIDPYDFRRWIERSDEL
jgi:excisionase family DNA binding protein